MNAPTPEPIAPDLTVDPKCIRVDRDEITGMYSDSPNAESEEWADVLDWAEENDVAVERLAGDLVGWGPYRSAYRLTAPDEMEPVRYYMTEAG
jgi:hypothetical protein